METPQNRCSLYVFPQVHVGDVIFNIPDSGGGIGEGVTVDAGPHMRQGVIGVHHRDKGIRAPHAEGIGRIGEDHRSNIGWRTIHREI